MKLHVSANKLFNARSVKTNFNKNGSFQKCSWLILIRMYKLDNVHNVQRENPTSIVQALETTFGLKIGRLKECLTLAKFDHDMNFLGWF